MSSIRPTSGTFKAHFSRYVTLVTESDVLAALQRQIASVEGSLGGLTDQQAAHAYEPDRWSVAEVLGHVIDCERVFGYRALAIARGDRSSLPAFDENAFAKAANHRATPFRELVEEFSALRRSHVLMFRHLGEAAWDRLGMVDEQPASTRAWAFVMAGHLRHHGRILAERYGLSVAV